MGHGWRGWDMGGGDGTWVEGMGHGWRRDGTWVEGMGHGWRGRNPIHVGADCETMESFITLRNIARSGLYFFNIFTNFPANDLWILMKESEIFW